MFSDICDELDSVKQFIDNIFIITNDSNLLISKNDFTTFYNQENNSKKQFADLLTKLKELNIQYERTFRVNGCKGADLITSKQIIHQHQLSLQHTEAVEFYEGKQICIKNNKKRFKF
jgi:hypothetical protein